MGHSEFGDILSVKLDGKAKELYLILEQVRSRDSETNEVHFVGYKAKDKKGVVWHISWDNWMRKVGSVFEIMAEMEEPCE